MKLNKNWATISLERQRMHPDVHVHVASQNSSPMIDRRLARSTGVSVDRPAGPDLVLFSARHSCCRDNRASGTRILEFRWYAGLKVDIAVKLHHTLSWKTEPLSLSHYDAFNGLLLLISTPLLGALLVLRSNLYSLSVHTQCSCSAPLTS